jgi:hypothetical protein
MKLQLLEYEISIMLIPESYLYNSDDNSVQRERQGGTYRIQSWKKLTMDHTKHQMKTRNLLFNSKWLTYTQVMNLGLNSNKVFCFTIICAFLKINIPICRRQLKVYKHLYLTTDLLIPEDKFKQQNQLTDENLTSILHLKQASYLTWNAWQLQYRLNNHISTLCSNHLQIF